jgi:hypothetical protein
MRKNISLFDVSQLALFRVVLDEDEYGVLVELYLHGKTKYSERKKNLSQCHLFHYKFDGNGLDIETGPAWREAVG